MNTPRTWQTATAAAATSILALSTVTAVSAAPRHDHSGTDRFQRAVSVDKIDQHLRKFQQIADRHGDRAAGTEGYEASARYVEKVLDSAGYDTERQYFPFLYFELLAPEVLTENSPTARTIATHVMSNSPSTPDGGVTADLVAPAGLGCTAADWAGIDAAGKIALVSRGTCPFLDKSKAAGVAGADAVVMYNNQAGELNGTLGNDPTGGIPSAGITQAEGQALLAEMAGGPVNVTLELLTELEERETFNVLTETRGKKKSAPVVMLGGHLDGVHDGPGINDNGSGTGTLLTVATELAELPKGKLPNKVRFAFWGAEESGLVGSTHYVNDLVANDPAELDRIATYLNFDMIGSPNYIVAVYDADESTYPAGAPIPPGSIETEKVFTDHFDSVGQDWIDYAYSGRSDYQAFINNGVAAGGLSSGSDGLKTEAQQQLFGGVVGEQYDQNYHSAGDDLDNVNRTVLDIMSNAVAHATLALARDVSLVEPDGAAAAREHRTTKVGDPEGTVRR